MNKYRGRSRRWPRRLIAAVILIVLFVLFFNWQQNGIMAYEQLVQETNLPTPFDGLRIAHLSDLHGKVFGENSEKLLDEVKQLKPDLIAITGDLIDQESQMDMIPALAEGLAKIAPTYYVTGNHEWAVHRVKELKQLLADCGVRVLSNSYEIWEREGVSLAIVGADDPNGPADQITGDALRERVNADYTILLSHRDTVLDYAKWGYDLVLCGHGHGGIVRVPLIDKGVLSTDRTFFPEFDGGLYRFADGGACYVSRGLGSNTVPIRAFRLFNRPDLPLIILNSGD